MSKDTNKKEDSEIIIMNPEIVEANEKAAYDIQIATAKRYPRDVVKCLDNALMIATLDVETAESCTYSVPRGAELITGPSVHLAKIMVQNWGNIRIESRVKDITNTQIISEAVCFDLESNVAVKVEVRRSIVSSKGYRYNSDMIAVTGNAANAIAYRNAVYAVIPKGITDKVYNATKTLLATTISTEDELEKRRDIAIKYFRKQYSATTKEILKCAGVNSINKIGEAEVVKLIGIVQALKDGDATPNNTFGRKEKVTVNKVVAKKKRLSKKAPKLA